MTHRQAEVIIHREGHPDRRVRIEAGQSLTVGRAEDNGIMLPDIAVSRRHARVSLGHDGLIVEDMGSGNGTFYRGRPVRRQILSDKDEIVVEPFVLSFFLSQPIEERTEESQDDHGARAPVMPDGRRVLARLEVIAGGGLQPEYLIGAEGITLGRSDDRGVVVPDPAASRKHAEIVHAEGQWALRDGGSVNGTYVNAQRAKVRPLAHGDRIRIGATEFRFLLVSEPEPSGTQPFGDLVVQEAEPPALSAHPQPYPASPDPAGLSLPGYVTSVAGPAGAAMPAPHAAFGAPALHGPPLAPPPGAGAPLAGPPVYAQPQGPVPYAYPPQPMPPPYGQQPVAPMGYPQQPYGQAPVPYAQGPNPGAPQVGYAGVEMAVEPARSRKGRKLKTTGSAGRPQGTWMERNIRRLTVGIGLLAVLLVIVKVTRDMSADLPSSPSNTPQKALARASESVEAVNTGAAATAAGNVTQLLQEGNDLFRAGKYVEAVEKYAEVQRISPNNPIATRMGYHACEFLVMRSLKESLVRKSTSAAEQQGAYQKAMADAQATLSNARGAPTVAAALDGLYAVRSFFPSDAPLQEKISQLERSRSAAVVAAKERKVQAYTTSIGSLFQAAQAEASRGNMVAAIQSYQKVLEADTTRQTDYYYQSEEQIRRCKATLSDRSREPYRQGLDALKSQDYLAARSKLREAISIDPYNNAAQSRLREAQTALDQSAQKYWAEGEVYERSNQIQLAIGRYRKVIDYSESPNSNLARKAKERIDRLIQ